MNPHAVERVVVVVPARNESTTIGACLRSIDDAAVRWGGSVDIIVAADSCVDHTEAVARATPLAASNVAVATGRWGGAGAARHAGTERALASTSAESLRSTWIASTDSDSVVPPCWITRQAALAAGGIDLVLGIVDLVVGTCPQLALRFAADYGWIGDEHPHVHGANLGVRASAYRRIGGWNRLVTVGEEHDLVARAVAADLGICRDSENVVRTSARLVSRVRDGFANDLVALLLGDRVAEEEPCDRGRRAVIS